MGPQHARMVERVRCVLDFTEGTDRSYRRTFGNRRGKATITDSDDADREKWRKFVERQEARKARMACMYPLSNEN